ncbi:uncharacterized protein si:ch211-171b20.3 isoform X1 [Chiloscyllium plagiosum]|uniref:uncharacterized protein si:ch211-171b20.3 isoform X1 n=2 Tax=Chiloscyllium plagiosum TaxID=36176 RepID=UPI001CB7E531|nr:uncharacterized protein si:ch211-171b20.3 isoform X1 [Chiloscyllium plagiosum]
MSWLDADDDDEEDDDYQLPEGISEGWRRGPMVPPRRVFKVGDLAPALSPVQTGLGSNLSPEAGLQSPTRPKAKPFRDSDKTTQERDDMYEVEELRDFLFPRIHQFHTISNLFFDLSINQIQDSQLQPDLATNEENEVSNLFMFCNEGCEDGLLHDAREKMSHPDRGFATIHTRSKEKQECTRRSLKHKPLHTKLFEELSKGQFPFDWSKRNGGALGGNKGSMATQRRREKELQHSTEDEVLSLDLTVAATDSNTVLSSELKRNDKNVKIPTVTQANGIQGCKTKNVQQSHKEFTDGTPETHAFSSKTHNGLCSSLSIPSNQKLHSYHNPLQGASASFIHRLTEIAGLECDTIRQEKIRKLKKRSDC